MRGNKLAVVLLLGLTGAACGAPPRVVNSSGGTNNSTVNVYNGYPGPNTSNNANEKAKSTMNANQNLNANFNANANGRTHSINLQLPNRPNGNEVQVNGVK